MIDDARRLPANITIDADVCIMGAGPAGIAIARELVGRGLRVCVLESGGRAPEANTQALAEGSTTGEYIQPLHESRARAFGGTAHLWNSAMRWGMPGFRCGVLEEVDLERREWLPHSVAWPFGRDVLDPFYARAQHVCGLGPFAYGAAAWERPDSPSLPVDASVLTSSVWQFGLGHTFTDAYHDELARAPDVTVYLHANVVEVETNAEGTAATHLRAACLDGPAFRVAARLFVLAGGGIENARLLLHSAAVQPEGLGNGHDLVGRYFMEHQYVRAGRLVPRDRGLFARAALYDTRRVEGTLTVGKLDFTQPTLRQERLLNASAALVPQHRWHARADQDALNAFDRLLSAALRLRLPAAAIADARTALRRLDYVAIAALRKVSRRRLFTHVARRPDFIGGESWSALSDPTRRWDEFEVILHTEQAPHPDNRITLDGTRDALGSRRARLHWKWREADVDSVLRAERLLEREIKRAGLGTLHLALDGERPCLQYPGLHHHMGTTRMHPSPGLGVVDEHGRVHGVANLYIAGCSVFPSGGYINPTLTIVALALRLADHLRMRLAVPVPVAEPWLAPGR